MISFFNHWRDEPHDASQQTAAARLQKDLWRAREEIRCGKLDLAEELLRNRANAASPNATYWNLMGLLSEARGDWNKARRCWQRALCANPHHWAAERNLRRYFELYELGWSDYRATFGDQEEYGIPFIEEGLL